jgi:GDP-L-fucose synthase
MSGPIYVAGHRGMVGSAIVRALLASGVPSQQILTKTRAELDLTRQAAVEDFLEAAKPEQVYLAAARVGGVHANNSLPADFILENLQVQTNVISAAFKAGVKRLLFLGSSCIYPRLAPQPMAENALLSGPLEPTNEPYAVAKIAGIKLCESFNRQFAASHGVDYRSVMPTNLYGPGDNYDPMLSHVIPGLIRRFHDAKQQGLPEVSIWGSGEVRREFLYVDDMARACLHVMDLSVERYRAHTEPMCSHINVGSGEDVTISELARMVAEAVGYSGTLVTDSSMPDGAPRKLMDSSRLNRLGWQPRVGLSEGLELAYADFLRNHE